MSPGERSRSLSVVEGVPPDLGEHTIHFFHRGRLHVAVGDSNQPTIALFEVNAGRRFHLEAAVDGPYLDMRTRLQPDETLKLVGNVETPFGIDDGFHGFRVSHVEYSLAAQEKGRGECRGL